MSRIIRVFPRRTAATPNDDMVRVACPPTRYDVADEVHISVAFTWDLHIADRLEKTWRHVAPVRIGGPATGEAGGDFVPGRYVKSGYVLTSRGCPNRCWFCQVWRREGGAVRELPVTVGWNLLDDNLLACSKPHQRAVFDMLARSKGMGHRVQFTGGFEAARFEKWHVEQLKILRPKQMFFAYDTPDDLSPLQRVGEMLMDAGWTIKSHTLRAYVLCGWPESHGRKADTFDDAARRMRETQAAGFLPMAMLFRDNEGRRDPAWMRWARKWSRPAIVCRSVTRNSWLPGMENLRFQRPRD